MKYLYLTPYQEELITDTIQTDIKPFDNIEIGIN